MINVEVFNNLLKLSKTDRLIIIIKYVAMRSLNFANCSLNHIRIISSIITILLYEGWNLFWLQITIIVLVNKHE